MTTDTAVDRGVLMSFEYLHDPGGRPSWSGVLPGDPEAYFLRRGEGEHAMLFDSLFTVLVSGDESNGQFGVIVSEAPAGDIVPTHAHADTNETFFVLEGKVRVFVADREGDKTSRLLTTGDFGYVPAGLPHAYRVEEAGRLLGVLSGGFERFFQQMGTPTDHGTADQPPFLPDLARMRAAAQAHKTQFIPDFSWPDA